LCGKHSANQIAAASSNMHGICRTSNLSEGLMYKVSQASFIKIPPFPQKISCGKHSSHIPKSKKKKKSLSIPKSYFSQSDCRSLIIYAQNLTNIKLEQRTYILSITGKFHQNPIIPSEDIMWKTFSQSD
jgi:hypothetical protein